MNNIKELTKYCRREIYWKIIGIVFLFILVFFTVGTIQAQPVGTKNLGFEKGNFDGWRGYTWMYRKYGTDVILNTQKVEGIYNGRHSIISNQNAYDRNTGNQLKMIPEGYKYSAKLGTESVLNNYETNANRPGGQHQTLSYTVKIDSSNALFVWKFAVVLEDPTDGHEYDEEPRFKISLYDENGDTISDCSDYDVYVGDAQIEGFKTHYTEGGNPVVWRDWTTVGANLLPYIGQTITIEFLSAGCTHRGHYGYGYFILDCMPLFIQIDYCTGDSKATLSAPSGFNSYKWKNEAGNIIHLKKDLFLDDPEEGENFICDMESETGCSVSLSAQVERYEQNADFTSELLDCHTNTLQFSNLSTNTKGSLLYLWDFGDGNTSEEKNPTHEYKTAGMQQVELVIYNPPSGCTDTLKREVESFSSKLVRFAGYTTYCPGNDTKLTAHGAYRYAWSTGETSESITIAAPGGNYWLLGYSSGGCVSDTIYVTIIEEPDWYFVLLGDTTLCDGDSVFLVAEGASEYLWDTGVSSNSIRIDQGGTYSVSGINARGCQKELSIEVSEVPIPTMDYSLSTNSIDIRHKLVEASATSVDKVNFQWDMGDGTVSNNAFYSHTYTIPSELIRYPVTVTAISEFGCRYAKHDYVTVDIFIPNVFTPNNDGINDLFMPGYSQKIFDRHGIVLYNGKEGWDGYSKGVNADPDTYYYLLNYEDAYGEPHVRKGFITLVR